MKNMKGIRRTMDMDTPRILIVDDHPEIREIIHILLEGEGFSVEEAGDGKQALALVGEMEFDLIILDIMMPGINGYQTCIEIRKNSNAPILFLSARTKDSDKTLGFSSGGDDYLAKPFSYNELISRSKALIRRYQVYRGKGAASDAQIPSDAPENPTQKKLIILHHLTIDEMKEEVTSNGCPLKLTDTEYAMLLLLVKHRRRIFSVQHLYESVWNEPYYYGAGNTVMVHIRNLRRKIEEDPKNPTLIRTVWGKGYRCD